MSTKEEKPDDEMPFAAHRTYYMALKIAVLVAAVALGTKLVGWW